MAALALPTWNDEGPSGLCGRLTGREHTAVHALPVVGDRSRRSGEPLMWYLRYPSPGLSAGGARPRWSRWVRVFSAFHFTRRRMACVGKPGERADCGGEEVPASADDVEPGGDAVMIIKARALCGRRAWPRGSPDGRGRVVERRWLAGLPSKTSLFCVCCVLDSPLATRDSPLATRHSPLASRLSPLASRLSPLASRLSPLASRL